jgi:integrase
VRFAAETGLRPGECFALRPEDVREGRVYVHQTLYNGVLGPPKRKASIRSVPLSNSALRAVKGRLLHNPHGAQFLFCAPKGGSWNNPSNFNRRWREWCVKAGLAYFTVEETDKKQIRHYHGPTFHALRHTFAALSIRAGLHAKEIQALMGHDSIETTMDEYGHLYEDQDVEAIRKLELMLATEKEEREANKAQEGVQEMRSESD